MKVQVLLSTYNGERYLKTQLDSVLQQDHPALELLIRDDGSRDRTVQILRSYAEAHPNIHLILGENVGFVRSYLELVRQASPSAGCFAFCDQDDLWLPDKISRAVALLGTQPSERPVLVGTPLTVVDADLRSLGTTGAPRRPLGFANALVECPLRGCGLVFNQATRQLLLHDTPRGVYSHDWWIYLLVSAVGEVLVDGEPRVLYRQHGSNVFGAAPSRGDLKQRAGSWLLLLRQGRQRLRRFLREGKQQRVMQQAREFQRWHQGRLPPAASACLRRFLGSQQSLGHRLAYAITGEVYRQGWGETLLLKLLIACGRL